MASCSSVSSNIASSINSINIAQGSGGSRLLVTIPFVAGLTLGNVVRYDVASSGYTGSIASTPETSEVFGVIESYSPVTNRFSVVMNGSITIADSNLVSLPDDPTGAGGGNDVYFLSGMTAGVLQNLAPVNINHIIKPVYQRAPHGTYTGSVVNYSGYRMGGNVQGALDTVNVLARVGTIQLVYQLQGFADSYDVEAVSFLNTSPFDLDATTPVDWNIEFFRVNLESYYPIFRYIDFPELSIRVFPIFNNGWVERVKVNDDFNFDSIVLDKFFAQPGHDQYNDSVTSTACYGQIIHWDATNRYLYLKRPTLWDPSLSNYEFLKLKFVETDVNLPSLGRITVYSGPDMTSDQLTTIPISETDKDIQFLGFSMPELKLLGNAGFEASDINYPFFIGIENDGNNPNYADLYGVNVDVYMKVKNKGVSMIVPDTFTVNEITADTVNVGIYDVAAKLTEIEQRLSAQGF